MPLLVAGMSDLRGVDIRYICMVQVQVGAMSRAVQKLCMETVSHQKMLA